MNTVVMSREVISAFNFTGPNKYIVISIRDPEKEPVKLNNETGNILDVFYLSFHDVDAPFKLKLLDGGSYEVFPLTDADARNIARFVTNYYGVADTVVCQCEAGISRSAGVAAAIEHFYNQNSDKYFRSGRYVPNSKCYCKVLSALVEMSMQENE